MNTKDQLPPLPEPDTHCFDDDTGKDVWSHSSDQMQAYALASLAQQTQESVANDRNCPHCNYTGSMHCGDVAKTHGGILNPEDCSHAKLFGNRITTPPAPQPAPVDERAEFKAELARMPEWEPDFKHHRAWVEPLLWSFWQARASLQSTAPQAGGWLPIESAPKERGARFIGLTTSGRAITAEPMYCVYDGPPEFRGWHEVERGSYIHADLQGWMPLPKAPQTKGQP